MVAGRRGVVWSNVYRRISHETQLFYNALQVYVAASVHAQESGVGVDVLWFYTRMRVTCLAHSTFRANLQPLDLTIWKSWGECETNSVKSQGETVGRSEVYGVPLVKCGMYRSAALSTALGRRPLATTPSTSPERGPHTHELRRTSTLLQ